MINNKPDFTIFTDGGSRGNPGPSAIGVVIKGDAVGKKEYGEYIGIQTNNFAEYTAVIFALKKLKQLIGTDKAKESTVRVNADSELLVKQVNGEYKIKEDSIRDLFLELWNLRLDFKKILFSHVFREVNTEADRMANYALDREENKLL
ncbi:MAG: ribonuclease HI family protein [Patescibacteria group bacterium]